jgi:hypothetical protein
MFIDLTSHLLSLVGGFADAVEQAKRQLRTILFGQLKGLIEQSEGVRSDAGSLPRSGGLAPEPEATAFSVITTLIATCAKCTNAPAQNFVISLAQAPVRRCLASRCD